MLAVPADYISALGINCLLTLESPADAVVRPWVWSLALFLGAALKCLVNEGVAHSADKVAILPLPQFMVMIEAEDIIVSLVVEHSLRIWVKAEAPNATPGSTPSAGGLVESESDASAALKKAPAPPDSSNLIGKINNLIATGRAPRRSLWARLAPARNVLPLFDSGLEPHPHSARILS
ncbi:hypothetical protein B0H19DRAFT_1079977 [Mycena capillaripes]|nr:hypothetical protein B0H19DRAFT_1079977 [Mycena capillaripes]